MLSSINPLGERARHQRWSVTVTAYVLASTGAGAVLGAAAGTIGALAGAADPGRPALAVAAAATLLAAVFDATGRRPWGPSRQVDEDWLARYRGWVYGAGFGAQLGCGVATRVTTATVYLVPVLAALTGSPLAGAVIGATFGGVRALPVMASHSFSTPGDLRAWHRRLTDQAASARRVVVAGTAGVALALAVVLGA